MKKPSSVLSYALCRIFVEVDLFALIWFRLCRNGSQNQPTGHEDGLQHSLSTKREKDNGKKNKLSMAINETTRGVVAPSLYTTLYMKQRICFVLISKWSHSVVNLE